MNDNTADLTHLEVSEEIALSEIYKELLIHEEIIYTVEATDEPKLRRNLSVLKAKDAQKLKEAGFQPVDSKLEFITIEDKELPKGLIKIQIVLRPRAKIKVYGKQIPSGELE